MTRRYVGNATVLIHYAAADGYLCRVTAGRKAAVRLTIWRPRDGFGHGIAHDASQAYDHVARLAVQQAIGHDTTGAIMAATNVGWAVRRRKTNDGART